MSTVVWDLDGTLVLTRMATWHAYQSLKVLPPPDFHVRPWQEWCTPEVHEQKGRIIAGYLRKQARVTPLMQLYEQLGGTILTNASEPVVSCLRSMFPQLRDADIRSEMVPAEKIEWLQDRPDGGLYLDDSERTVIAVRERTTWSAATVRF